MTTPARRSRRVSCRRLLLAPACVALLALAAAGTGFGSTSATVDSSATLLGTLSMSSPTSVDTSIPACTKAVVPQDTDGCSDVRYTPGSTGVLNLGELSGTDVQAGALTWRVTTTNPGGYSVQVTNTGAAPFLRGSAGTIADVEGGVSAADLPGATRAGMAVGTAAGEGATSFAGSAWGTSGQGAIFRAIPTSGAVVAQRGAARADDPVTLTFAAASSSTAPPAPGAYSGTVQVVASVL